MLQYITVGTENGIVISVRYRQTHVTYSTFPKESENVLIVYVRYSQTHVAYRQTKQLHSIPLQPPGGNIVSLEIGFFSPPTS